MPIIFQAQKLGKEIGIMLNDQRLYQKIIKYLAKGSRNHTHIPGTFSNTGWAFSTLHQVYPQLCDRLIAILSAELGYTRSELMKFYVPKNIYAYTR